MKRVRTLHNTWRWAFTAAIAVLLVVGLWAFQRLERLSEAGIEAHRASEVLRDVDGVVTRVRDAVATQRGFLLTADPRYQQPLRSELAQIEESLADLAEYTAGREELRPLAVEFTHRVELKLSELSRSTAAFLAGDRDGALEPLRTGASVRLTDRISEIAESIRLLENQRLADRIDELEAARVASYVVMGGSAGAALLLGVIAAGVARQLARGRSALLGVLHERDEASQAERLAYQRLQIALRRTPLTVFTTDRERRYTWIHNPSGEVDIQAALGKRDEDLMPLREISEAVELKEEVLRTGEPRQRRITLTLGGVKRTFEYAVEPLRGESNEVDGLAIAVIDTTAIIDAERRHKESEALSNRLREASGDCVKIIAADGTLREINKAGLRLMEVDDPQTILDRPYADLWGGSAPTARRALEQARRTGEGRFQEMCLTAKGNTRWWDVLVTPLRGEDGQIRSYLSISRDISELVRTLEALREKDAQLNIVFSQLSAGVVQTDLRGRFTLVNDCFCDMVGRDRSELMKMTMRDVTHLDDLSREEELFRRCVTAGEGYTIEKRYSRPDGGVAWANTSVSAVTDDDGRVISIAAVSLDIGAERLAADRLRESEEMFRWLADSMPQIVWSTRADGFVDYFNSRWYEHTGMAIPENPGIGQALIGDAWAEYIHPDDLERTQRTWATAVRTGEPYNIEYRIRGADGQYRWFMGRGLPVREEDGSIARWFGTCTDIHDKHRSEDALRLLKEAVESANDAVIITEAALELPGPRIEYVNPAFERMTGYAVADVLGKTPRILQGPRTDQTLLRRLRRDLREKESFHGETINYRKDKSEYVVEWRITPLRGPSGEVVKWVAVQRDVSDRKRIDEERERLLASERVAREDAERTARMKDEFVATLSHELRTPLNAILGWTEIARRRLDDRPSVERGLEVIDRNARAQAQMVEDLLDMSRVLSGKMRLEVESVDLAAVVDAAVAGSMPAAAAKEIHLETYIESVPRIEGDPGRLQQVVWNLLSNAIKFTPRGGTVVARLRESDGHIEISVTDTGQGMTADFLPYVFERFRQADASTTRRYGGLGLGLSIVKNLVEMHGGTVHAHSDGQEQGSTFRVRLPFAGIPSRGPESDGPPPESEEAESSDADEPPQLNGVTALVVDDDDDSREFVRYFLEANGARVETAASAATALSMIDTTIPDVIVSDIGMPEQDGYDLIRRIRGLEGSLGGIPAVALTALARTSDRVRALRAGFQAHVAKPVDPKELLAAVARLVTPHAAAAQAAAEPEGAEQGEGDSNPGGDASDTQPAGGGIESSTASPENRGPHAG